MADGDDNDAGDDAGDDAVRGDDIGAVIRPWHRTTAPTAPTSATGSAPASDRPVGHALVMPGIGYTVDRPLLYWAARALSWRGWQVDRLWLDLPATVDFPGTIARMNAMVDSWLGSLDDSAASGGGENGRRVPRMAVTKSLSTLTYPHLAESGMAAVLLTPVLNPPPCDPARSVIETPVRRGASASPMPLICAGDADPYFDAGRARMLTDRVTVCSGANHSIEVAGDYSASIRHLADVTSAIVRYADDVAGCRVDDEERECR